MDECSKNGGEWMPMEEFDKIHGWHPEIGFHRLTDERGLLMAPDVAMRRLGSLEEMLRIVSHPEWPETKKRLNSNA